MNVVARFCITGFEHRDAMLDDIRLHYVIGGAVDDCGHFLSDQRPDVLATTLPAFFARCPT